MGMQYRRLGRTGLQVSVLGYGVMTFGRQTDLAAAKQLLTLLKDRGVNFYDNAEVYAGGQSEVIFGQAVKELGWERQDYVVSTKVFFGVSGAKLNARGLSRKHVIEGVQASLKRLGLDYVDLVFCHRPDPDTPIEETVRAMNHVIERGWAFYWGTSEWSAVQISSAWRVADRLGLMGPAMDQCQYNLIERSKVEKEYLPLYDEVGLGLSTWSPLYSGLLSGKYLDNKDSSARLNSDAWKDMAGMMSPMLADRRVEGVRKLKPLAEKLGCSLAQLALAWCCKNPHVSSVLTGATKHEQIEDNMKALDFMDKLTPEVMAEIDAAMGSKP